MKRLIAILFLPFLAPLSVYLAAVNLWNIANGNPIGVFKYSGGEVENYYIVLPVALILQLIIGIPIGLLLAKADSQRIRISCVIIPSVSPIIPVIISGDGSFSFYIDGLLIVLPVMVVFAIGSLMALYCIHPKINQETEQAATRNH
jgi:hypothetical protein